MASAEELASLDEGKQSKVPSPLKVDGLTLGQAREAVNAILTAIETPAIAAKLEAARRAAGHRQGGMMLEVVPQLFEIQGHVMTKYGLNPNDDGFEKFAEALQGHESNADFNENYAKKLKAKFKELTTPIPRADIGEDDEEGEEEEDEEAAVEMRE